MQKSAAKALLMSEMIAPGSTTAMFRRRQPRTDLKSTATVDWLMARANVKRARVALRRLREASADLILINQAEARFTEAQKALAALN